jgi:nitric oxide synthase oxygenase domain/subunit
MEVRDMRHLKTGREIFEASADHIERARKMGGKIIPMLTLYDPSVCIVSPQFFNYAGAVHNGETVGYRNNIEATQLAKERGWKGDTSLPFTLLPFMVSVDDGPVELFDIPEERNGKPFIRETKITHPHPTYKKLATLALHDWMPEDKRGLFWYDVPAISNMRMVGGGEEYAAQFSGKYSSGEIANNFTHPEKMESVLNKVRPLLVAQSMGDTALRLDRLEGFDGEVYALLNTAVEASFKQAGFDVATPIQMSDGYFAWTERFEKNHGELPPENPDWLREGGSPAHRTQYYQRRYPTAHIAAPPNAPGFFHPDELVTVYL